MTHDPTKKLHTACDECRTRKLKCPGESPECSRCIGENLRCVYSPQKQMGRPKKRRRQCADENPELSPPTVQDSGIGSIPGSESVQRSGLISPPKFDDLVGLSGFQPQRNGTELVPIGPIHEYSGLSGDYLPRAEFDLDFPTDSTIDPSLWSAPVPEKSTYDHSLTESAQAPCACLSAMYLTSSELQTLSTFAFPAVVPQLRRAVSTALDIVRCERCSKESFGAIQNVQASLLLLSTITERYHRVLSEVDAEAERLERSGEKKPFRVGDNSPTLHHLHTGTLDCPMGFDLELEPKDWRKLAKEALKTEVLGGGRNVASLSFLLDQFEERQKRWHENNANDEERKRIFGTDSMCRPGNAMCVSMIGTVRRMVQAMKWD